MYSDTRLTKFLVKDLILFTKKTLPQSGLPKHILGTFIYVLYLDCFYVLHGGIHAVHEVLEFREYYALKLAN